MKLKDVLKAGHQRRAQRLRRRPDVLRPDAERARLVQRHPDDGGALPRPGRHAARRRHDIPQPRPRAHVRAHREARREGALPAADRTRDRRHGAAPESRPDREPRLAAGRDDAARPQGLQGAGAQADACQLPRSRRVFDGTAVERRLDRRRGAEHPRGLRPRVDAARPRVPLLPRGVALLVRRPQRVPRRPRLLRRAAEGPAVEGLRGDAARADHDDRGEPAGRRAGRPVPVRQGQGFGPGRRRRRRRTS